MYVDFQQELGWGYSALLWLMAVRLWRWRIFHVQVHVDVDGAGPVQEPALAVPLLALAPFSLCCGLLYVVAMWVQVVPPDRQAASQQHRQPQCCLTLGLSVPQQHTRPATPCLHAEQQQQRGQPQPQHQHSQ